MRALVQSLEAVLPQTQCTQCGYDDCNAYAKAMAAGLTTHNRCVPGGRFTLSRLAELLEQAPLEPSEAVPAYRPPRLAIIDEAWCIGCTLCIQACPVDAIVGGAKRMHTVLQAHCTGCELCVAPCPVDCIAMRDQARALAPPAWLEARAPGAASRYARRNLRLRRSERARRQMPSLSRRRAAVEAAVARARARRREA